MTPPDPLIDLGGTLDRIVIPKIIVIINYNN